MNSSKLKNNTVIITGASEGLGKEFALCFSRRGFSIGLIARRKELLTEVMQECLRTGAKNVYIETADVTDSAAFRAVLSKLDTQLNGTGIFIANAGVTGRSKIKQDNYEQALWTLKVNLLAAIDGIEWIKERMVARGEGIIVGISSVAAARGIPESGTYAASKAALTNYLEGLNAELSSLGVSVVNVSPGFILTSMTKKNLGSMPFLGDAPKMCEKFTKQILKRKYLIIEPYPFKFIYWALTVCPNWLFRIFALRMMQGIRTK